MPCLVFLFDVSYIKYRKKEREKEKRKNIISIQHQNSKKNMQEKTLE